MGSIVVEPSAGARSQHAADRLPARLRETELDRGCVARLTVVHPSSAHRPGSDRAGPDAILPTMRFRTTILGTGKTAAGIQVPADVVDALGPSRKPAVVVTINGYSYRSTVATMGGVFMIGVSNDVRKSAGVAAGETVDVDLELDTAPREVVVPSDVAAALDRDPDARRFFDGLSYSNKRRILLPIEDAKTPETRQRRLDKSLSALHDGRI
jgi:hypothetical protein